MAILWVMAFSQTKAQTTYTFEFDNGETREFIMNYDDPFHLPKYSFGLGVWGFSVFGEGTGSFQVFGEYRFDERLMLEFRYSRPFGFFEALEGDGYFQGEFNTLGDFNLMGHYHLFSSTKPKMKKLAVDYSYNTIYMAEFPRTIGKSLDVDFGYNLLSNPQGLLAGFETAPDPNDIGINYYSANNVFHNLNVGLSYHKGQSYEMITSGKVRRYMRMSRLYAYMSYAIASSHEYFTSDIVSLPTIPDAAAADLNRIGYRFGWQWDAYFVNSPFGLYIGLEFGQIPSFQSVDFGDGSSSQVTNGLMMAHIGVRFGQFPKDKPIKDLSDW